MSIFVPCEGGVYKHVDTKCNGSCACDSVAVISLDNNFVITVPITGFMLEMSTNHQFLHSLDEFVYVYAFGDRVGELTISGIAFTDCVVSKVGVTAGATVDSIYKKYLQKRLSKTLTPSKITIGNAPAELLGFLTGMRIEVPNPQLPIAQWVLRFQVILNSPNTAGDAFADAVPDIDVNTIGIIG
jgi:hypothetical protein